MKITIVNHRPGLYLIDADLKYDISTIKHELVNEAWQDHKDRKTEAGLSGDPYTERFGLLNPKSDILKEIMSFVNSDSVKQQIINELYNTEGSYVSSLWEGWSKEEMFNHTFWGCMFNKDLPGFHIPVHLDTRLQIATAMLYFSEYTDPQQATTYYTDDQRSNKTVIDNKFGNGVLHLNDHTAWHEGANNSSKDRYSLICGLLLKLKD